MAVVNEIAQWVTILLMFGVLWWINDVVKSITGTMKIINDTVDGIFQILKERLK